MSFSIIAIKTGGRIKKTINDPQYSYIEWNYLKVLESNTLFQFNNSYEFKDDDFKSITYNPDTDVNIFTIQSLKKTIPVSVQAIVGGNGSGKSSLMELIYWANYNIGAKLDLFEYKYPVYEGLDFELFYRLTEKEYFLLKFEGGNISRQKFLLNNKTISKINNKQKINTKTQLKHFFYSVVINYSHYSLNELEIGSWIHPLFHKNDAYQTPIVLNPKREIKEGINIEKERKLVSRRLQALALESIDDNKLKDSLRDFGNGKIAKVFELKYDPEYNMGPYHNLDESKGKIRTHLIKLLPKLFDFKEEIKSDDFYSEICLNYLIGKLVKMGMQYPKIFGEFVINNKLKEESEDLINQYLIKIKSSSSHVCFKAKGIILYLKYKKEIFNKKKVTLSKEVNKIDISKLSKLAIDIKGKELFFVNTFMLTPPSFFRTDIRLSDDTSIDTLSSGERQKIHSTSSLLYHIVNLNSVEEQKGIINKSIVRYEYVNLILDEIELYYHPDWQRLYLNELIKGIEKLNPDKLNNIKGINITFLTHSPFILSDIPSNNVLVLDLGVPQKVNKQTFGANIHDLLANDFFLRSGFMGEFAKTKINEIIKILNNKIRLDEINTKYLPDLENRIKQLEKTETGKIKNLNLRKEALILERKEYESDMHNSKILDKTIDLIGEPTVRVKLREMYNYAFLDKKLENRNVEY